MGYLPPLRDAEVYSNTSWAVGNNGIIFRLYQGFWEETGSPTVNDLNSLNIKGVYSWAAGSNGTIIRKQTNDIWVNVSSGTSNDLYSIFFISDNLGWAAGEGGVILKSTDGGNNWINKPSGTSLQLNCIYFTNDNTGYAVGGGEHEGIILKSTDAGETWQELLNTVVALYSIYLQYNGKGVAVGNDLILQTGDGGYHWVNRMPLGTDWFLRSVYYCNNIGWIAAGVNGTIVKSTDAGLTWFPMESGTDSTFYSIYYSPGDNTCYATGGAGISKSNGTSWTNVTISEQALRSIFFLDQNTGWAIGGMVNGGFSYFPMFLFKTTDGGIHWNLIHPTFTSGYEGSITSVFFTDQNNGFATASRSQTMWVGGGAFLRTTDGGLTWTGVSTSYNTCVFFVDQNTGWNVGGYNADLFIRKTIDGGNTWTTQMSSWFEGKTGLFSIYFIDHNSGWTVGRGGQIYATTNGGTDWIEQNSNTSSALLSVFFTDQNHGTAVGQSGLILTTNDGGTTWTGSVPTTETLWSVCYSNANDGWIVGENGLILHTTDSGENWAEQNSGTTNALGSVFFVDEYTGWVCGSKNTILMTTNGGITFAEDDFDMPEKFTLLQNYPNPFNPATTIKYTVPVRSAVTIKIFDILGNEIETLVNEEKPSGSYEVTWNAGYIPSGVYFYQLKAGSFIKTNKMMLIR